ncbi:MAG: HEAT repeat domain-containing protein [Thermogutta sp.]|nr:HEAT repeat domain-containing protein [Thermogutta sp.]
MARDDRAVGVSSFEGQATSAGQASLAGEATGTASASGPHFAAGPPAETGEPLRHPPHGEGDERAGEVSAGGRGRPSRAPPSLSWLLFSRLVFPGIFLASGLAGLLTLREIVAPPLDMPRILSGLERGGSARAEALTQVHEAILDPRYRDLKADPELAESLIRVLETELRQPITGSPEFTVAYRAQLCRLVRELDTPRTVPVLLIAVECRIADTPQLDSPIRRAAAEGVVTALERHGPDCVRSVPGGVAALCRAAKDPVAPVRAAAAAALGHIGGDEVCDLLREMLHDDTDVVRYNAAIALAYAGRGTGLDTLHEFLRSENVRNLADTGSTESVIGDRTCKLLCRALFALDRLCDRSTEERLAVLHPAMEDLCLSRAPEEVRTLAMRVDLKIERFHR